jgi:hypothetical protein
LDPHRDRKILVDGPDSVYSAGWLSVGTEERGEEGKGEEGDD